MYFASSTRAADKVERDCCEVICDAPTIFQERKGKRTSKKKNRQSEVIIR